MNCWHCETQLTVVEEDVEDDVSTELSCPECGAFVVVYKPAIEGANEHG